jgi:integrase
MRVSKYKVGHKRFIAFVDEMEIPVFPLANSFIYDEYLHSSFSTKERVANELKLILEYFHEAGIDLDERVGNGDLLSNQELAGFYKRVYLRKDAIDTEEKIEIIPSIESKAIRNAIASSLYQRSKVSTETVTGRLRTLRKYLSYVYGYYHGDRLPPEDVKNRFIQIINRIKLRESYSSASSGQTRAVTLDDSVIPAERFQELLEIIRPSSPRNPFKKSRLRNYLMISILIQAGIRRSELCKIKISDCLFHGDANKIKIYSHRDDPTDPRLNKPNKKVGRAHISGIHPSVMRDLKFYIDQVRNNFPKAHNHDFVFVAEKNSKDSAGQPLVREMVNYILSKLSETIGFNIHPHLLRHKWNETLDIMGQEKGLDWSYLEDIRRNSMGWSAESQMGRIYNDRREQIAAIDLMNSHQERVDGRKKEK